MVYKFLVYVMFFISSVFASSELENIKSFQAKFIQVVTNETNNNIEYKGKLFIKDSGKVLWKYETPILKNVYILDNTAIIDEPELEQAIYTTLDESIDIVKLLRNAKKVDKNKYETQLGKTKYTIFRKNGIIKTLSFIDELENNIVITFLDPKQNIDINDDLFLFTAPEYYDIIKK